MSIEIRTDKMVTIFCDDCGEEFESETMDTREAEHEAISSNGWTKVGKEHFCEICTEERKND